MKKLSAKNKTGSFFNIFFRSNLKEEGWLMAEQQERQIIKVKETQGRVLSFMIKRACECCNAVLEVVSTESNSIKLECPNRCVDAKGRKISSTLNRVDGIKIGVVSGFEVAISSSAVQG